ncbi:MAG TPA: GAF domain-containing protein [Solirubrobacterales bacterium]
MTDQNGSRKGLDQFTKDVLYSALVSVTAKALGWVALLFVALMVALVAAGWDVPAWTLVAMALVAIALVYVARRVTGREADELKPKLNRAEDELDRHDSYGRNICSVLDTFQKIVAKDIKMSMDTFIEQGILIPGRDVMQENGRPSDLRMSVLIPSDDHFLMVWASGHSLEAKQKYNVPINQTIARVAYDKKAIQVWNNAPQEERGFVKNPKATRGFKSMVSIPMLLGGATAGVFNVVTDKESAFDPADVNYLTSLGSIIQLAFGMAIEEWRAAKAGTDESQAKSLKRAIRASVEAKPQPPAALPPAAPQAGVGSSDAADGMEGSDE